MLLKSSILFLALGCFFNQTHAQHNPSVFDKFIRKTAIVWAAYANDTITLDGYNLSNELVTGFKNKKTKIAFPLNRDTLMEGRKISYINKNELQQRSFPYGKIDTISSSKINVQQILYVSKGKLYSYIPWVSPRISVYTSEDRFLGTSEYFSSALNYNYKFRPSKRDKVIFITTTKRKYLLDSFPRADRLKELYGVSMLEAIWSDVMNDKNEIVDIRSGQKTSLETLNKYYFANTVNIPLYDSLGNVTGSQTYNEPISPSLFQQLEITQSWFYNSTKKVVTNNISDITLSLKSKSDLDGNSLIPVLKITLK